MTLPNRDQERRHEDDLMEPDNARTELQNTLVDDCTTYFEYIEGWR
jgi:hypothetical protein